MTIFYVSLFQLRLYFSRHNWSADCLCFFHIVPAEDFHSPRHCFQCPIFKDLKLNYVICKTLYYVQEYVRFWIWLTFRASLSDTGCTLRMDLLFFLVCFIFVTSAEMAGTELLGISRFNLMLSVCSISMSLLKKFINKSLTSLIKISLTLGGNLFATKSLPRPILHHQRQTDDNCLQH